MFKEFEGYNSPIREKVNKNCTIAIYVPENPKKEGIIGINTYNTKTIYLYNNTIINISNKIIIKLLNTLTKKRKKIKNKRKRKI